MTAIFGTSNPYQAFGLSDETAQNNSDFVRFLKANKFEHRFGFFRDIVHLTENPIGQTDSAKPTLLVEGIQTQWSEIEKQLWPKERPPQEYTIPRDWRYIGQGLNHTNSHNWPDHKLSTCWIDPRFETDEEFRNKYYIELVSHPKSGFANHCHARLINAQGEVISVGLVLPIHYLGIFRSQKGHLASPDPIEFKGRPELATTIEIDQAEYNAIKDKIETDQEVQNLFASLITRNCSEYVREIFRVIDIDIENQEFPSNNLFRKWFHLMDFKPPPWLTKALHYIAMFFRVILTPFYNLGLIALGALYTDPKLKELEEKKGTVWVEKKLTHHRPFEHWTDFFNCNTFRFATAWKVSEWQKLFQQERRDLLKGFEIIRRQESTSDADNQISFDIRYNRSLSPLPNADSEI